jgi:CRISPR-associated protein Cas6
MAQPDQVVDLSFSIRGSKIPADHGYALYAAISRVLPSIHGDEGAGIHPIRGQLVGGRQLALTATSRLVLRSPGSRIPDLIRLAGQRLALNGDQIVVGVPTVHALRPAATLRSRMVVIRGFMEPETFLEAVRRQMAERDISGSAALMRHRAADALERRQGSRSDVVRRTFRIHDKEVVGFALAVSELTAEDSIRLQELGLGGRRRFGCGLFVPLRG